MQQFRIVIWIFLNNKKRRIVETRWPSYWEREERSKRIEFDGSPSARPSLFFPGMMYQIHLINSRISKPPISRSSSHRSLNLQFSNCRFPIISKAHANVLLGSCSYRVFNSRSILEKEGRRKFPREAGKVREQIRENFISPNYSWQIV